MFCVACHLLGFQASRLSPYCISRTCRHKVLCPCVATVCTVPLEKMGKVVVSERCSFWDPVFFCWLSDSALLDFALRSELEVENYQCTSEEDPAGTFLSEPVAPVLLFLSHWRRRRPGHGGSWRFKEWPWLTPCGPRAIFSNLCSQTVSSLECTQYRLLWFQCINEHNSLK